ncbi:hypothetical protein BT96DRAFT_927501 [Gymnopus androsaceus JB14]|uniref:Uncharacterized protein n=1 Tax=Gymnopus androsaceus JB14 TaxID=1447944 RepID=A0A6A4GQH2_9AGAR|nr:hypothetical protein BT96DRAFT_927501 [Gymnopus androsaceus JB14]
MLLYLYNPLEQLARLPTLFYVTWTNGHYLFAPEAMLCPPPGYKIAQIPHKVAKKGNFPNFFAPPERHTCLLPM